MAPKFWDVPPSAVMMVAAHIGDLDAAKKLGLRTAFVHRPLEFGPARTADSPAEGRFDFTAEDFLDLATQLGF
jgi:2-haloacid dehalogenase